MMKHGSFLLNFVASFAAVFVANLVAFNAFAAPIPGGGSSKLISPHLGLYRSPLGFQIHSGLSGWSNAEGPKNSQFIATVYKANDKANDKTNNGTTTASNEASLTVRIDRLERDTTLDRYVQKWKKEYPKYGFDVLGSKPFTQAKQRGYVLDLINRDNGKQLRQVVFLKQKKAVLLTCRDRSETFKDTLKDCNQIIRTFQWTE